MARTSKLLTIHGRGRVFKLLIHLIFGSGPRFVKFVRNIKKRLIQFLFRRLTFQIRLLRNVSLTSKSLKFSVVRVTQKLLPIRGPEIYTFRKVQLEMMNELV